MYKIYCVKLSSKKFIAFLCGLLCEQLYIDFLFQFEINNFEMALPAASNDRSLIAGLPSGGEFLDLLERFVPSEAMPKLLSATCSLIQESSKIGKTDAQHYTEAFQRYVHFRWEISEAGDQGRGAGGQSISSSLHST